VSGSGEDSAEVGGLVVPVAEFGDRGDEFVVVVVGGVAECVP
jgi:hypothetical protein